ncbi:MAG: LamG-like jellyroll fold domain-containing protein, partial [Kiritimatiellia bacterium]|nr:LamG-like jellyroll fold domain-containing protein [Kiritimatiellia bacterium]
MKKSGQMRVMCGMCAIVTLGGQAARAATGVWAHATGGFWADAANWQDGVVPSGAPDVADFSTLDSGETVTITNDTGVGAMVFSGAPDAAWSVQAQNGARLGFDGTPLTPDFTGGELRVSGGTLTLWPYVYYAANGLVKSGSGRVRLVNRYSVDFKGDTRLDGGTLILSNNAALVDSAVVMNATNAVLLLESDAQINGVRSLVSPAPDIALNGHTLEVGGTYQELAWEGRLTGGGRLVMVRGALQSLALPQAELGSVALDNGSLTLGKQPGRTVAWWRFDEESDIGRDSGPLANDLVKTGTPTKWYTNDAVRGGVLSLDSGAYLAGQGAGKTVFGIPTNNSPFTVAFWLKPSASVPLNAILCGWGTFNAAGEGIGMRLKLDTPATPILLADWIGNPTFPYSGNLKDGAWHHVAAVYTGSEFQLHLDGKLVRAFKETRALSLTAGNFRIGNGWLSGATYEGLMDDFMIADWAMNSGELYAVRVTGQEPDTSGYAVANLLPESTAIDVGYNGSLHVLGDQAVATLGGAGAAGGIFLQNGGALTVGGSASPTSTTFRSGIAGDGRFVKRGADYTLTLSGGHSYTGATEIQEGTLVLNSGLDADGLQAYYRFNDAAQLGKDSSGNGYHLDPVNSPVFVAAGRDGGAAGFNKTDQDRFEAAVFPETLPTGNSSYTVMAWCNPSTGNLTGMPVYWGALTTGTYGSGVLFRFNGTSEILVSNFGNNQEVPAGYDLFTDALNGGWHHIACTYDGTTRMRRVYIDGVLKYSD